MGKSELDYDRMFLFNAKKTAKSIIFAMFFEAANPTLYAIFI